MLSRFLPDGANLVRAGTLVNAAVCNIRITSELRVIQAQSLEAPLIGYQGDHFCMQSTTHADE